MSRRWSASASRSKTTRRLLARSQAGRAVVAARDEDELGGRARGTHREIRGDGAIDRSRRSVRRTGRDHLARSERARGRRADSFEDGHPGRFERGGAQDADGRRGRARGNEPRGGGQSLPRGRVLPERRGHGERQGQGAGHRRALEAPREAPGRARAETSAHGAPPALRGRPEGEDGEDRAQRHRCLRDRPGVRRPPGGAVQRASRVGEGREADVPEASRGVAPEHALLGEEGVPRRAEADRRARVRGEEVRRQAPARGHPLARE
eukprot:31408-Pelagococcus_subviridis.AAC.20